MYSDTATTLYEFSRWLQIDPFVFAGVTKENDSSKCGCILQETKSVQAEVKNKFWSRQNFEESLRKAEFVFRNIVGEYPAPKLISETKPYDTKARSYTIIPDYLIDNVYKLPSLELVNVCAVDKSDLDNLVITFVSETEIDLNDLLFYLPESEASYVTHPKWGDLRNQIRPVLTKNKQKSDTTYTITIPSFLCVKPSLYSNTCLSHEANTYLDFISVYKVVYNDINGKIVFYNSLDNSDVTTTEIPFKSRIKHFTHSEIIEPAYSYPNCTNIKSGYVDFEYISGFKYDEQMLDRSISYPIYLMAAMFSIVGEDCGCNYNYASQMISDYRKVPLYREVISGHTNAQGQQYRDIVAGFRNDSGEGYMLYVGFIEAIKQLNNLDKWR